MVRQYDFSGFGNTGLFICHVVQDGGIGVFQASISNKVVKSISFSILRGSFLNYSSEMSLFLNRLNSFLIKGNNVVSLNLKEVQKDEDTYHDEQLEF